MRVALTGKLGALGLTLALCATWTPPLTRACPGAQQHRLVPLGTVGAQRLVLLQLQQYRYARKYPWSKHMKWSVRAWLRLADTSGRLVGKPVPLKGLPAVRDARYTTDIQPVLRRALARARRLSGFRPFGRPKLQYCPKLARRCGPWRPATTRTGRLLLGYRVRGQRARFVDVANSSWYAETVRSYGDDVSAASTAQHRTLRNIRIYYAVAHR